MMSKPTREDMNTAAVYSPAVYASIQYFRQGDCTFEEAMMMAVNVLIEQNKVLFDEVKNFHEMSKNPFRQVYVPTAQPCKLEACPPGLFLYHDTVCFVSEYSQDDPYVVASGEIFWGGTNDKAIRANLIVVPLRKVTNT